MTGKVLTWIATILGTLLINLVLFAIVPFIQELLKDTSHTKNEKASNYHIVMEFKQEEKEKPKPKARQVREVNAGSGSSALKSQSFKFQPDLAVAGGSGGVAIEGNQEMEVMVFSESEVDEPPRELSQTPLDFPEVARAARASGTLEVEIVIGRDGRVESVTVLDSPHPSIAREAERAIPKWTFQPGKNKGIPVRVKALKRIKFQLN
jgi:TonB family protein